jgi:phospholipid/cholesterol/gamma-HCH transport system substrate-binding protein
MQPGLPLPDFGPNMRTSNLLIGTTTLALIAVAFAGLLGYRKFHVLRQQGPLRIVFEGAADGLHKGGSVNFDGVQIGTVISLKLESPRRIVVLTRVDNSAPIRKDTVVGLEFQGLTGVAAISLTGGAAAAPAVPLDKDGVPTLTADLSEIESIRDSLHNVDKFLVDNQAALKEKLRDFETDTASLADDSEAIDGVIGKADSAFDSFDSAVGRIDSLVPGLAGGSADELLQKVRSIRELADSFNKHSGTLMEEGRRSLLDISEAAVKMNRKFDPQAVSGRNPAPPRRRGKTRR